MTAFTVVALGQAVSFIGTGMTRFAIMFWAWQETGQATALALAGFFAFAPSLLVGPVAGALVDRWNRKLVMMLSDLGAGLATTALLILVAADKLEIWHIYAASAFAGVFESFQWPAFSAAISTMVPKEQYARANGMLSLAQSVSGIMAPALAGGLVALIGVGGIMAIDVATFLVAIAALLIVQVPQPRATAAGRAGRGGLLSESVYGFRYILQRQSLLALQLVFTAINLTSTLGFVVLTPMILARTASDATILGTAQAAAGFGGVAGGLLLATWGGPKRRIHGVLGGMIVGSLFGQMLLGLGRGTAVWALAGFFSAGAIPILNGANQAIWQAKVAPDVQGRVFAARRMIAQIAAPAAMLLAGPLADRVFEPAMAAGGRLAPAFGDLIGIGPGAGMALMLVCSGALSAVVGVAGYLVRDIRDVEAIMPDHDVELKAEGGRGPVGTGADGGRALVGNTNPGPSEPRARRGPGWAAITAAAVGSALVAAGLALGAIYYLNDGELRFQLRDGSTAASEATTAPTSVADEPTEVAPTAVADETTAVAPTAVADETTAVAPTAVKSTAVESTTVAPTAVAPTAEEPATIAPVTAEPPVPGSPQPRPTATLRITR